MLNIIHVIFNRKLSELNEDKIQYFYNEKANAK
jgi:hypothetical protein